MAAALFDSTDTHVVMTFSEPVQVVTLDKAQAFWFWENLHKFSVKLSKVSLDEFGITTNPKMESVRVRAEGTKVQMVFSHPQTIVELPYSASVALAEALRETAYKAERNVKGLLPTKKEVDRFEEWTCGTPKITNHGARLALKRKAPVFTNQPLLSRFIRKPWF